MLFEINFLPPALKSVGLLNMGLFDIVTKTGILSVVGTLCLGPTGDCLG